MGSYPILATNLRDGARIARGAHNAKIGVVITPPATILKGENMKRYNEDIMKKKEKFISQCCMCKKVRRKEGYNDCHRKHMDEWGHYHKDLKEMHDEYDLLYSHGYCDDCGKEVMEEVARLKDEFID